MEKDEIINMIKENLSIRVDVMNNGKWGGGLGVKVTLYWNNENISCSYDSDVLD